MQRTIVIADLHGRIEPLVAALEHAAPSAEDEIVIAGDLIDIGHEDALSAAERAGAVILAGNHEVAAALGLRISPQHPESLARGPEFAERFASGQWPVALARRGWLISHAGISSAFLKTLELDRPSAEVVAGILNERFVEEMRSYDMDARWPLHSTTSVLTAADGPLWFRPLGREEIAPGLRQIVGHTPPEAYSPEQVEAFREVDWLLADSGGHAATGFLGLGNRRKRVPKFRYAIIEEDGSARVVEG